MFAYHETVSVIETFRDLYFRRSKQNFSLSYTMSTSPPLKIRVTLGFFCLWGIYCLKTTGRVWGGGDNKIMCVWLID